MAKVKKSSKQSLGRFEAEGQPGDVAAIRAQIQTFLRTLNDRGRTIGGEPCGVYAFYD